MVHNLVMGPITYVGRGTGTRYTPYYIRHRTEVSGFMTILHGDGRIYNDIFVQGRPADEPVKQGGLEENERVVGTWCFDEYPTYEEWITWFDLDMERPDMRKLAEFHEKHLPVWIDGNAITFDSNYFGNNRGISTVPGPFASEYGLHSVRLTAQNARVSATIDDERRIGS